MRSADDSKPIHDGARNPLATHLFSGGLRRSNSDGEKFADHWKSYWATQCSPHHHADTFDFYRLHAMELKALWAAQEPTSVLEIGCGSGELFEHLGFDGVEYRGVDYADSMLDCFSARYPGLDLVCADAGEYRDAYKYDLIFSNGVLQYLDEAAVTTLLLNARAMVSEDGILVLGSLPWRQRRLAFVSRNLFPPYRTRVSKLTRDAVRRVVQRPDGLGNWFSFRQIDRLATSAGFSASFYGSLAYVYRFHAVLSARR